MIYTIFLAWQSEIAETQKFVQKALEKAGKQLKENGVEVKLVVRPAAYESGSPNINELIQNQLNNSDLLIADVTGVYKSENDSKHITNPNVMFEAGFGVSSLGEDRCIFLADTDNCDISKLSFDINHNRISSFSSSGERDKFAKNLASYIISGIESIGRRKYILRHLFMDILKEVEYVSNGLLRLYYQYDEELCDYKEINQIEMIVEKLMSNEYSIFQVFKDYTKSIEVMKTSLIDLYATKYINKELTFKLTQLIDKIERINTTNKLSRYTFYKQLDTKSSYIIQHSTGVVLQSLEGDDLNNSVLFRNDTNFIMTIDENNFMVDYIDNTSLEEMYYLQEKERQKVLETRLIDDSKQLDYNMTKYDNVPMYKIADKNYANIVAHLIIEILELISDISNELEVTAETTLFNGGKFHGLFTLKK